MRKNARARAVNNNNISRRASRDRADKAVNIITNSARRAQNLRRRARGNMFVLVAIWLIYAAHIRILLIFGLEAHISLSVAIFPGPTISGRS